MPTREEIAQQALNLSLADRAYLADVIEQSLAGRDFETPEIASARMAEIERRAQAYERGETAAEAWRTVVARIRSRHTGSSGQ
jgi:putative addiction module component (TIGR02574 family)